MSRVPAGIVSVFWAPIEAVGSNDPHFNFRTRMVVVFHAYDIGRDVPFCKQDSPFFRTGEIARIIRAYQP